MTEVVTTIGKPFPERTITMTESERRELQELSRIPILENELMWICRVTDEPEVKDLSEKGDSEFSE